VPSFSSSEEITLEPPDLDREVVDDPRELHDEDSGVRTRFKKGSAVVKVAVTVSPLRTRS